MRFVIPILLTALLLPAAASGSAGLGGQTDSAPGRLKQLRGPDGCVVDRAQPRGSCSSARALAGPGPFMGSRALDLSPDARHLYVAASSSNAIAIFERAPRTGRLRQRKGTAGCIAASGRDGCATAVGLEGPNSVAVSPDGANVYATSRTTGSVTAFRRNTVTGALTQLAGGCIATAALPGCTSGRGLGGADVVVLSRDGSSVYVGGFFANAVAAFSRDPSTGELTQLEGTAGCIAETAADGCATGLALSAPEGLSVSHDDGSVYVATAVSNALVALARDPITGELTQATDGSGCVTATNLAGCATGRRLLGANAVTVSPGDDDVYVTSLFSNSVTSFTRAGTPAVTQKTGTSGCMIFLVAVGCSLGEAMSEPEGLAASDDGANVYATAFASGAIDVLDRESGSGNLTQKAGAAGCVAGPAVAGCRPGRRMRGVGSIVVSEDGRNVYATAFNSNAVVAFRRSTALLPQGTATDETERSDG